MVVVCIWNIAYNLFWHYGWNFPEPFIYVFIVFVTLDFFPTILLHVQYWLANRNSVLMISKELNQITYSDHAQSLSYSLDDIAGLLHVASFGGGSWYSFSEYRYFRITFSDGKEIIITSLMMEDIKYFLEMLLGLKANKKVRAFAFIRRDK